MDQQRTMEMEGADETISFTFFVLEAVFQTFYIACHFSIRAHCYFFIWL